MATLAARPMPNSCMPPHQTGTLRRQRSWIFLASSRPPTRLTLMLMTRPLPSSRALRASLPPSGWTRRGRWGFELALEAGVVDDVVVGQGLFDQEEVEGVE